MANYVKFFRGSQVAYDNVIKNSDTLYFITDSDSNRGKLYLGEKLISGDIVALKDLEDIVLNNLDNNDFLVYDKTSESWTNKNAIDAIGEMKGATNLNAGAGGLVPGPGINQQNLFLRGDGTWASVETEINGDYNSIILENNILSLKDFGKKFYKFIPASGTEGEDDYVPAHYELQIVNSANPWKENLEPKVVKENEQYVLGWFEPNLTTFNGVVDELDRLKNQVNDAIEDIVDNTGSINNLQTQLNNLSNSISNKADITSVYTKDETNTKINEAIANVQHLKRKTFQTLSAAEEFITTITDPENYIYMISNNSDSSNDKYTEYLYIDGALEKIGIWEVNLDDYVTDTELVAALSNKVDAQEGYSLISTEEKNKLAGIEANAQKNFIAAVDTNEFSVSENGKLSLISIESSKVNNLDTLLNNKADASVVDTLQLTINNLSTRVEENKTSISSLNELLGTYDTRVGNIENQLQTFVTKDTYNNDMVTILDSITWKDIS